MMGIGIWELIVLGLALAIFLFPVMVAAVVVGIMLARRNSQSDKN
jgi:hypothetical protein